MLGRLCGAGRGGDDRRAGVRRAAALAHRAASPVRGRDLRGLEPKDVAIVFRILPREFAADVFEYLPFEVQEPLLKELGQEHVAAVLNQMDPDDRTTLLEELPGQVTQRLISLLSPEERRIATTLLGYPEDSVGRRMTPDYIAVRSNWTGGAGARPHPQGRDDKETFNVIYVVDAQGRLVDDIRLRELVLADPATPISELMDNQVFALQARQDQEEAVREFIESDRVALPVVDSGGMLGGHRDRGRHHGCGRGRRPPRTSRDGGRGVCSRPLTLRWAWPG